MINKVAIRRSSEVLPLELFLRQYMQSLKASFDFIWCRYDPLIKYY